ncbi:MAG: hypothetical protein ACOZDD_07285, partial [Bacteroidota bacterium]
QRAESNMQWREIPVLRRLLHRSRIWVAIKRHHFPSPDAKRDKLRRLAESKEQRAESKEQRAESKEQ